MKYRNKSRRHLNIDKKTTTNKTADCTSVIGPCEKKTKHRSCRSLKLKKKKKKYIFSGVTAGFRTCRIVIFFIKSKFPFIVYIP